MIRQNKTRVFTMRRRRNNSPWRINPKQRSNRQRWIASLNADTNDLHPQLPEYLLMLAFHANTNKFVVGRKVHLQLIPFLIPKEPLCYQIPQLINDSHSGAIELTAKIDLVKTWSPRFQRIAIDYNAGQLNYEVGIMVPEKLTKCSHEIADQLYSILSSGRLMLLHDRESTSTVRGVVTQALGNIAGQRNLPLYIPPHYHERHFLQYALNGEKCQIGFPAIYYPSFKRLYELYSPQNEAIAKEPPFLLYTFQRRAYDSAGNQLSQSLGIYPTHIKLIKVFFETNEKPAGDESSDPTSYNLDDYHHITVCGELHSYSFPNGYGECEPVDSRESTNNLFKVFNRVAITHWRDASGQEHAAIRHIIGDKTPYIGSFPFVGD